MYFHMNFDFIMWLGGVVWCSLLWWGVAWCGVVWCGVVWCASVWLDSEVWLSVGWWHNVVQGDREDRMHQEELVLHYHKNTHPHSKRTHPPLTYHQTPEDLHAPSCSSAAKSCKGVTALVLVRCIAFTLSRLAALNRTQVVLLLMWELQET